MSANMIEDKRTGRTRQRTYNGLVKFRPFYTGFLLFLFLAFHASVQAQKSNEGGFTLKLPEIIVSHVNQEVGVIFANDALHDSIANHSRQLSLNGSPLMLQFRGNEAFFNYNFPATETLSLTTGSEQLQLPVRPIPLWLSVFPPLIAILMALLLREVFVSLFLGILSGTTIIYFYQGHNFFVALFKGILALVDTYVLDSLTDSGHMSIIIFSTTIGGMVHLITRNGGMQGVVNRISRFATTARSGQLATWTMGIAIFFDDYANTLVVGNTMRPVADRLRISREKLAYIVDSTAAPVASVAFVTTWIGAELSYIQDGIETIGINESAYTVFLHSLGYSFYPFLALIFILILIFSGRDFGPMYPAEVRARSGMTDLKHPSGPEDKSQGDILAMIQGKKARPFNALIPVLVIIIGTIAGLVFTGWNKAVWDDSSLSYLSKVSKTIGAADSYAALLWSSLSALVVAVVMTLSQRLLSLKLTIESVVDGFKSMLPAVLILTLAWSVALITKHLHTADFISQLLLRLSFSPYLVPALTFILGALVAFSTGSSWGTMAILYPLILPSAWMLTHQQGMEHEHALLIFYNVVSAVLAGSVLGDHCSPISDTTILSSLASQCNHIEHVRTQMPYALTVGSVALLAGTIPAAFGLSMWLLLPLSVLLLVLIVRLFGKKSSAGISEPL
jgi:Na+/H+ antiporter NhaC